jgi:DNA-binding LacI/PurR family transcriptional regulator
VADATRTRATIFDVAEAAGVSITTVSHVFSGKRRVNEATRARVIEAADRLSYRPRATARALAAGRTNTLALSVPMTGPDLLLNSFFARLLPALSLAALDRGYSFLYVPHDASPEMTEALLDAGRVDAAVLLVPSPEDPFVRALMSGSVPFVTVGPMEGVERPNWIGEDPAAITLQVLDHLAERGYERPGLLSLGFAIAVVEQYRRTFRAMLGESAPEAESAHVSERDAYDAALGLLARDDRPDALFCLGDSLAVGAVRAAEDAGVSVPDELGIVCVLDSPLATHVSPQITAVDVQEELLGQRTIEVLDLLLRDEPVPGELAHVGTRLVERASTRR